MNGGIVERRRANVATAIIKYYGAYALVYHVINMIARVSFALCHDHIVTTTLVTLEIWPCPPVSMFGTTIP